MDGLELPMWMIEIFIQSVCGVQSFLIGILAHMLEQWGAIEQIFDGFFVSHSFKIFFTTDYTDE